MYCSTFHGLNKWFVSVFERFGWMILANARVNDKSFSKSQRNDAKQKILNYSNELNHLMSSLNEASYVDPDKMHDIECMKHKLHILMIHFDKDFKKAKK